MYNVNKIPIHVYTTRVLYREIYNLFMQALITGKKVGPWRCFFSYSAASNMSSQSALTGYLVLYMVTDQQLYFLVPDSYCAMVRNDVY
jgi:hypothetical protein